MLLTDDQSDVAIRSRRHVPVDARSGPAAVLPERHGYRPSAGGRWLGLGGTGLVALLVIGGLFISLSIHVVRPPAPTTLAVFDVTPPAAPAETPPQKRAAPVPVERRQNPPPTPVEAPQPKPVIALPAAVPTLAPPPPPPPQPPEPPQPEPAAPRVVPAPPAPQVASNGPDTWEGRVLARLNKHRRYPGGAMLRRQQGVPYVRFVMDREGRVLSSRLERSSGVPDLDREAVALPRHAQPLPKPPADKPGDTLELVVPVEFFLTGR
jgi:protein TonB